MRSAKWKKCYLRLSFGILCSLALCSLYSSSLAEDHSSLVAPLESAPAKSADQLGSQDNTPTPIEQPSESLDSQKNIQEYLLRPDKLHERLDQMSAQEIQKHPYLRFRRVLNRPPKLVLCFFVLTLIGVVALIVFPQGIAEAKDICRQKFFGSFGIGLLASILTLVLARPLLRSEVGSPLAFAFIAFWQLGTILGLVVTASLIGEKVGNALSLTKLPWLAEKPSYRNLVYLVLGALLLAAALTIPNIGNIPRIGTRLVVLIGIAGFGALLKSKLAQPASPKD